MRFAPPEDQKFRHLIIEERDDGAIRRRFASERIIVFRKTPTGYRTEVTIIRNTQSAGQSGAMFLAAMAGLKGRPIHLSLDQGGALVAIEDELPIWDALCRSLEAATGGTASRRARAAGYISPLRALPPERRRAMLGSLITPLIAVPSAPEGDYAISLPARGPDGNASVLAGRESRHIGPDGMISIETSASGDVVSPGGGAAAHIIVSTRQRVDSRTGLIVESIETRDTAIGTGKAAAHDIARTTSTLTLIGEP